MVKGLRSALSFTALCGLVAYGCSSAAAAQSVDAPPPPHEPPRAAFEAPDGSSEGIGSSALEHKLDQLEKNIQGHTP